MRLAIVDDEPLARLEARRLVCEHQDIEIVGEADTLTSGMTLLNHHQVDAVLLDVDLAGATGFDLLASLDDPPDVIFTTAHSRHAVLAFAVGAVDYCVKPLQRERLAMALDRVRQRRTAPTKWLRRLLVKERDEWSFVALDDVLSFDAEGNYTRLTTADRAPWVGRSLIQLESRLDPDRFFRISRQTIVNLAHVRALHDGFVGLDARMSDGKVHSVSRRRAAELRRRFSA